MEHSELKAKCRTLIEEHLKDRRDPDFIIGELQAMYVKMEEAGLVAELKRVFPPFNFDYFRTIAEGKLLESKLFDFVSGEGLNEAIERFFGR